MKKTIAILLAAAILALCLSGCGSKKEVEFGANVSNFIGLTMENANDLLELCAVEYMQMQDDGIGAETFGEEYFSKCSNRFQKEGGDLAVIIDRCSKIDEQYQAIMASKAKAENADALKDAAQRIYEAHQKLLARSTNIYGPAEDFLNECSGYFADASQAHADAVELLEPYHHKPGYSKLVN